MRAVLTVIGQDKVGIVAGVSTQLAELNLNIVDMTQTIMQDFFTMMMMLEVPEDVDYEVLRQALDTCGETLGVKITIQNEAIFDAMHKL
ncbi:MULTISPECIES: ACT domain-containing protein [Enterococcus]|uniref:UPF0237 protein I573_01545 n=1 Tax=Enterococcus sulfureus ATCC 49903 TaxID=1140003 RepID=S0P0Y2_9ENTE|nr:ACT domain-containing protein [Enterococcus sulfureus]EOT47759.1 hypothetical protein OMY_01133 [Enterococcus sulfureus ATCC 49903]EOT83820.1 hypothetical protein I573_01545 [Enterococcus sulfureus ATCC 49903]